MTIEELTKDMDCVSEGVYVEVSDSDVLTCKYRVYIIIDRAVGGPCLANAGTLSTLINPFPAEGCSNLCTFEYFPTGPQLNSLDAMRRYEDALRWVSRKVLVHGTRREEWGMKTIGSECRHE